MARSGTGRVQRLRDEDSEAMDAEKAEGEQDGMNGSPTRNGENEPEIESEKEEGKEKKSSAITRIWKKLDLDLPTVLMMMKAALPPVISLAMYQATDVAKTYTTLGYLVAIVSILGFCIMPRAKFVQTMTMNVFSVCFGAAIGLLELWSSVKAREHTTPPGLPPARYRYNSSQSAVCAVWLFFQIWFVNSMKAKFPQFTFPVLLYAIFVNVTSTFGPQFQSTAQAEAFIRQLLITFLTGLAISTGVSLLIIPVSCRTVVSKEITAYIGTLQGALKAHKRYFVSLEQKDLFRQTTWTPGPDEKEKEKLKKPKVRPEIEAVKSTTTAFMALHGKLNADLPFAKREVAYGRLTPEDYESISKHLRAIMMPMVGLGSLVDLFERVGEIHRWDGEDADYVNQGIHDKMVNDWNDIMRFVHEPFSIIIDAMDQGLAHVLLRLQLTKPPKSKKGTNATDPEASGGITKPGDKDFAAWLEQQCNGFYKGKDTTLRHWLENKGIELHPDFFKNTTEGADIHDVTVLRRLKTRTRNQRQLYIVLYIIFLLHSVSSAILGFVKYADKKDQAVTKKHLIAPGKRRFKKWVAALFKCQDANQEDETIAAAFENSNTTVYMGEAYRERKDPEHLPPKNAWEKFGNLIRATSGFLRSPESSFGFRCACATMSIAVMAFLHDTQIWFTQQRIVWAMIMVAISMTPTAGQSAFTFLLRIVGTIIAMLVAWLIWYIPDQHTVGVLVFLWVFASIAFYLPLKRTDLLIVGLISVVTTTLIIGYELEVRKIGVQQAESNGQPFYPIYKLAPYRLACVVGGLAVAFIWTFFPYPITEHSALRQKLGGALYLSANFYSIMHETVLARIRGDEGDLTDKTSPGFKLEKARYKVFAKQMLTLQGLKMHSAMVNWEFPLGGKFPKKEYDAIIGYVTNIMNYTALLGHASGSFTHPSLVGDDIDPSSVKWFHDLRKVIMTTNITSHEITSLLALLSSSITSGQPLPPYLKAPQGFQLTERMEAIDHDILSIEHIGEPGYAAFAVLQVSTRCIQMDIEKLLNTVKKLVGELDFSFHIVSTQVPSETSSLETLVKIDSGRSKQD